MPDALRRIGSLCEISHLKATPSGVAFYVGLRCEEHAAPPEGVALRGEGRTAPPGKQPCVAKSTLRPRDRRLASSTARCVRKFVALRRRPHAASSKPSLCATKGGLLCYFVVSCTVRGSIDEIACPRAAFSGPGKFIPFLTWSFETAAVGSHDSSMLFRKNCQNACANERDSIDEGSKADEMPHPGGRRSRRRDEADEMSRRRDEAGERSRGGTEADEVPRPGRSRGATKQARCCAQGLVAGGASVEACLHAKESRPIDGFEEKSLSHAKATIIRLKWRP